MAKRMQDKESIAGMSWLVLLIIAGWGGLVRFLMDVKQGKAKWSWINAFAQIVVSAFTGVIGGLISIEGGLSIYMILATAGDQVNSELWWAIQNGYGTDGQNGSLIIPGNGGSSYWGGGGRGGARGGVAGDCYGAGGGGAYDAAMSGNSYNGGQGKAGIVYIEEYS